MSKKQIAFFGITTSASSTRSSRFEQPNRVPHSYPPPAGDLDPVFSIQQERVVAQDNTVRFANRILQIERTRLRATLAGCLVTVCEHLDGTLTVVYCRNRVGRFTADGTQIDDPKQPASGKPKSRRRSRSRSFRVAV